MSVLSVVLPAYNEELMIWALLDFGRGHMLHLSGIC